MRNLLTISKISYLLTVLLLVVGTASAQWGSAVLESVVTGPTNDELGRSAIAIDDQGILHLVFDRQTVGDHDFYYTQKLNLGTWIDPIPVGDPGASLQYPYLDAHKPSGTAYLVYLENGLLKLGLANDCNWVYYDLQTPYLEALYDPCVAVDADGYAHIAVIIEHLGEFKMGYGYWDGPGTNNFYFQIIEDSQLGGFGSGASPAICVRSNGSVAVSYRGVRYLMYQIDVVENASLGGMAWSIQTINLAGHQCYSSSIKATPNDDLHLAFHGNMPLMFPNDVYYTSKPAGSTTWYPPLEATGATSGGNVKMAVEDDGTAHVVYMETSGNIYTGNILYTTNQSGSWVAEYLLQGNKYAPTLVMDQEGNGNLAFQEEVTYTDNDVYYYGYVAPIGPPPNVDITLTPHNPPIQIPPEGGSFSFDTEVTNNGVLPILFDVWTDVVTPGGGTLSLLTMLDIALTPGASRTRTFDQNVPDRAPAGMYTYRAFAGSYFYQTVADADSFEFEKQEEGDGLFSIEDWFCTEVTDNAIPETTKLASAYPNPFNPETTLRYELAERTRIELAVFDLQGRKVTTLVDRLEEAGLYAVTWSGQNHPAGVYFARLITGDTAPQVTKLILIK